MSSALPCTRAAGRHCRQAALLVSAVAAGLAADARAARFGVPDASGGDPPGYFMLVSADAVNGARSQALGDIAHALTLYIEVASRGLTVELYDPGVFDPAGPSNQLDENVDTVLPLEPSIIRYVLRDPTGMVLANTPFGPDTAATEKQLVTLFSSAAAPTGIYQLDVTLEDAVADEHDVTVFGVSVPGHQVFTYNLTGGQLNQGGARIAEPLAAFPWLVGASSGSDAVGPLCGVSFISYDLDAALDGGGAPIAPPSTDVTTRQGYRFPAGEFPPSGDARWTQTRNGGLPADFLDSNDHGIWSWEFSGLTVPEDVFGSVTPPFDLNCFSIQVLDFDAAPRDVDNWPSVPPFGDGSPRRIYLPEDDGSVPRRAWLGHSAQVVAGFPIVTDGQTSTLEVTIELGNPHAFDMTSIVGTSSVTPDAQVSDPVLVAASGGLAAVITGRRIDFTGDVPAGTTATVVYRVDITPTGLGRGFLTGDDVDFVSPGAPTAATYLTPYTPSLGFRNEVLGPACQIEYEAVPPRCVATAVLTAERLQACPGTEISLDGLLSEVVFCPGGTPIYQWRANGVVFHPFPAADTILVTPYLNDTWTLDVACSTDPVNCTASDSVTFDLYPSVDVAATADPLTVCPDDPVNLGATVGNGTPPFVNGRWTTDPPGQPGDLDPSPTLTVRPTQTTTYTYSIEDDLGCVGSDDVVVVVDVPVPVITPDPVELCPGDSLVVTASGGETYVWTTNPVDPAVEGATRPDVTVSQVGTTYTVTASSVTGCTATASVTPVPSADPIPGPVGPSLRVRREASDTVLSWLDVVDPASGYEAVFLECPTRDWRVSCGGQVPDVPTLAASPTTGAAVVPGTGETRHAGALGLGDMIFYYVRALSPCAGLPGPVRD